MARGYPQKEQIEIPFVGGIDSKTASERIMPGKLQNLINGSFDRIGQINKRNGHTEMDYDPKFGNSRKIDTAQNLFVYKDQLLLQGRQAHEAYGTTDDDDYYIYSLDSSQTTPDWDRIGSFKPLTVTTEVHGRSDVRWRNPDVDETNGYQGYVWESGSSATIYINVNEIATGANVIDHHDLGAAIGAEPAHAPKIFGIGNNFWVYGGISNNLKQWKIDTTDTQNPGVGVFKKTNMHTDQIWDACYSLHPSWGPCVVIAYKSTLANTIEIIWYNTNGAEVGSYNIPVEPENALTIFQAYEKADASYKLVIAYQLAADHKVYYKVLNIDATSYSGPQLLTDTTVAEKVLRITGTEDPARTNNVSVPSTYCMFYIEIQDLSGGFMRHFSYIRRVRGTFWGIGTEECSTMLNTNLASKAFTFNDKPHVWTCYDTWLQATYFLKSHNYPDSHTTEWVPTTEAKVLYARGQGQIPGDGIAPSKVVNQGNNKYLFAGLRKDFQAVTAIADIEKSVMGIQTEFVTKGLDSEMMGPCLHTCGGYVGLMDNRFQDLGFMLFPERLTHNSTQAGGGLTNDIYYYKAVYEWTDRQGQKYFSAPSPAVEADLTGTGANKTPEIRVPCLQEGEYFRLGQDGRRMEIHLYRTLAGEDVFHKTGSYTYNYTNLPYVDITDDWSDVAVEGNPLLYTEGGIVENIYPGAAHIMTARQDRVFLVTDDDPENIWYSKVKTDRLGLAFSDFFTKRVSTGGPITALAVMDYNIIVFKENQIRAFSGPGPNDLGYDGTFSEDRLITTDAGCVDQRTIVHTDKGLIFKSHKGIYLLNRQLQVQYIGAPVEFWNDYPVLGAKLVQNSNQVRFLVQVDATTVHTLVYDYLVDQWSNYVPTTGKWLIDSVIWQGNYTQLNNNAKVDVENDTFKDGDEYYNMKLITPWFRLTDLQGYQRVYWVHIFGGYESVHDLRVKIYYDYGPAVAETKTLTADGTFAADYPYQFRFKPTKQKCQAIAFEIEDINQAGTGESLKIASMALTIGRKGRNVPLKGSKTV